MNKNCSHKSSHLEVSAETMSNLHKLAHMCGYKTPGKVVDKLVREKMAMFDMEQEEKEEQECDDV